MNFEIDIYSPRWGHSDKYSLDFEQETLTFRQKGGAFPAATLMNVENCDPEWDDVKAIFKMLNNDSIYPPHVFPSLLEHVWQAWRNHELDRDEAQTELVELARYLNDCTQAKPQTEFWTQYF